MKQLTLNDFIAYNNPCFSCGSSISIKFGVNSKDSPTLDTIYINTNIEKSFVEIDLKITYAKILKVKIFYKSNKFICNNLQDLTSYLKKYNIHIESKCSKCPSNVRSQSLTFNINKQFLEPIKLYYEIIFVSDQNSKRTYSLYSYHLLNKSDLILDDYNNNNVPKSTELKLPLITIFDLANKDKFLEKIKKLLIFL